MIQTTAPRRERTRARTAKGSPIRNPSGLQSSMASFFLFDLIYSSQSAIYLYANTRFEGKKQLVVRPSTISNLNLNNF